MPNGCSDDKFPWDKKLKHLYGRLYYFMKICQSLRLILFVKSFIGRLEVEYIKTISQQQVFFLDILTHNPIHLVPN